ncbi:MAG: hypothetical protein WD851_24165 [Pirellulales bacterium]
MNDLTLVELRTLVERAVRPVRTTAAQKMRMREELLAHLTAIFEEELTANPNESLALVRAAQRFGNIEELTEQLQDSVSRAQSVGAYLETFLQSPCPTEAFTFLGAARYASRVSVFVLAFNLVVLIVLFPWMLLQGEFDTGRHLLFAIAWPVALAAFMFGLFFLSLWVLHAQSSRAWTQTAIIAALSTLLVPAVTFAVVAVIVFDVKTGWESARTTLPLAALLSPLLVFGMAWTFAHELRQRREWVSLEVDSIVARLSES